MQRAEETMRFCPKCNNRLRFRHVKLESTTEPALACDKCGFWEPITTAVGKSESSGEEKESIKVVGETEMSIKTMPTTTIECPKCHNNEAYWWFLQTRAGDEATTQFYRCTKCEHTWRVYA